MTNLPGSGLYAITPAGHRNVQGLGAEVRAALAGGAGIVQFRDKTNDRGWKREAAAHLKRICSEYAAPLIINDDARLAQQCGAEGVHLGRDDEVPGLVRELASSGMVVGVSAYDDLARAVTAAEQGATYLAFGSIYTSASKPGAVRCSLEVITRARSLGLPLVAIGGITPGNGAPVIAAGASYLAAISGVFGAADICAAAAGYAALWPAFNAERRPFQNTKQENKTI